MPRPNRIATLLPLVLAALVTTACNHYQGPRGSEAEALFALYNGDWILDAGESDPALYPIFGPLILSEVVVRGGGSGGSGGPVLGPRPCPRGQICIDRPESSERTETEAESPPAPVPDSVLRNTYQKLATYRAPRLTLRLTSSSMHVSPTGLGTPLEVPMDARKTEVDQELGDFPVKAWSGWKDGLPSLTLSVGDDESWISDTYELAGDGTLVVTRKIGGGFSFLTNRNPRFVYRRPATPAP